MSRTVYTGATVDYKQDYVAGVEYRTVGSTRKLESIAHAEGRRYNVNVNTGVSTESLRFEYSMRDHPDPLGTGPGLGNTRITFTDKNSNGKIDVTNTSTNEILSEQHYYPFGLNYGGNLWMNEVGDVDNRYLYNGKERTSDHGLGWYNYGARWYDASIGRWNEIDPLAENHYGVNSYNYVLNNPMIYIDPFGLDTIGVHVFDESTRPNDNGVAGTSYTADVYVFNDETGDLKGPYYGSSYPNSNSNTDNTTSHNTLNVGDHKFNNKSGHKSGTKKGLNLVDSKGNRKSPGTDSSGNAVTMTYVNVHEGASDNGNYSSRGSEGCITIAPTSSTAFFNNFDFSGSGGNTGKATGTITIYRGNKAQGIKDLKDKAALNVLFRDMGLIN